MMKKVSPDKEKAISLLEMVKNREKSLSLIKEKEFSTIRTETYYEIIKELATALLLTDGIKFIGENAHKEMIFYLTNYNITEEETIIMQDLRIRRNNSVYEGKTTDPLYLENHEPELKKIINRLKDKLRIKL